MDAAAAYIAAGELGLARIEAKALTTGFLWLRILNQGAVQHNSERPAQAAQKQAKSAVHKYGPTHKRT